MLLWLALWWADWLALEDFSYSLFTEFCEVRRIHLPRTRVNKDEGTTCTRLEPGADQGR
jgi:hypothetical protein